MATLEVGTTPRVVTGVTVPLVLTGTVTLNKFSGDTYQREYLPEKLLTKPPGREGGDRGSKNPQ